MFIDTEKDNLDNSTKAFSDRDNIQAKARGLAEENPASNKVGGKFIALMLLGPFITAIIISSDPAFYFLGTVTVSIVLYGLSRFIGFFVKRNPDYYKSVDYNEEDE